MQLILVVEDKASMAGMLEETLTAEGYRAIIARDGAEGIEMLVAESPDLVLTDLKLPGSGGIEVLRASKGNDPLRPVIVMTAHGSVETAVAAMKSGAYDFMTKPFSTEHLLMLISRSLENQRVLAENILLKEELSSVRGMPSIIGKSGPLLDLAGKIKKAAPSGTTILLSGESGTGKELFAHAIHQLSPRREMPFVVINCAAIPRDLLESELFGYEKGAFTGAYGRKLGKFELADGGTIFLDEISELDTSLQAKLLRALQEGEIERVGGKGPVKVDVRVIAATNRDLPGAVAEGAFREDLFYRLNVFPLSIPPLRERAEDIPLLVDYFITRLSSELNSKVDDISPEALSLLGSCAWKGNVRELRNTIERAMILCESTVLESKDIIISPLPSRDAHGSYPLDGTLEETAREALRVAESERISRALLGSNGNKTKAAKVLGVSYKTLLTKIKDYGLGR